MEIYTWEEEKKLEDTILSVLDCNANLYHHVYQDNYYNSVSIAEKLLVNKTRACGTIRSNRGLPNNLKVEIKNLKNGESTFR